MATDPGNTNATARRISITNRTFTFSDSIGGPGDRADIFTFTLTRSSSISGRLSGLRDNADIVLIGPTRLSSRKPGRQVETLTGDLRPGTYFVSIVPKGRQTPYNLSLRATPLPADKGSNNINAPTLLRAATIVDRLGDTLNGVVDNNDFYRISVAPADVGSTLLLELKELQANANLILRDPSGTIVAQSRKTGRLAERISRRLTVSGNYTVQVIRADQRTKTSYRLNQSITPPADTGGDLTTPVALRQWNPSTNLASNFTERIGDVLASGRDVNDTYSFVVPGDGANGSTLRFDLTELLPTVGANLTLYRKGGDGVLGAADIQNPLATSSNGILTYQIAGQTVNDTYYIAVDLSTTTKRSQYRLKTTFTESDDVGNSLVVVDDALTDPNSLTRDILDVINEGDTTPILRQERVSGTDDDVFNFTISEGERQRFISLVLTNESASGQLGLELWKETVNGPVKVVPGTLPQIAGTLGAGTYFVTVKSVSGTRIRYSLNTTSKDNLVIPSLTRDIAFGSDNSNAQNLTDIGGVLYYAAQESGTTNFSLWRSDGFLDGTIKLGDFGSDAPSDFVTISSNLYFLVNGQLYTSAGQADDATLVAASTSNGNVSLTDLSIIDSASLTEGGSAVATFGNYLYFSAALTGEQRTGLYRLNTVTNVLQELVAPTRADVFGNFTKVGSSLYFTSSLNPTLGVELFRINNAGTNGITSANITALDLDENSADPAELTVVGDNTLYFTASAGGARKLYRVDNTNNATTTNDDSLPFEIAIAPEAIRVSEPNPLKLVYSADADALYFTAVAVPDLANPERELFKISDASGIGVYDPGFVGAEIIDVNASTPGGTPISSFNFGATAVDDIQMTVVGSDLYMVINGETADANVQDEFELYKISSTGTITAMTTDTETGSNDPSFGNLTAVGDKLFFTLGSGTATGLWVTDAAGTGVEQRQGFDAVRSMTNLIAVGLSSQSERLFFKAEDNSGTDRGVEIWAVDP